LESIKAWRIMKEGIRATIKSYFPKLPDSEVQRILEEIERECQGLSVEDISGCVYRKLEEIRLGKAGGV